MHEDVKRFFLDGEMSDDVAKNRTRHIEFLENEMRGTGYVPALDLEPQFTVDYQPDTETFKFELSVYGMYVGGKEAWDIAGVTHGKRIPRYTRAAK